MSTRLMVLRRIAGASARAGALGSAIMLAVSVAGLLTVSVPQAAAATAGTAQIVVPADGSPTAGQPLDAGGSATPFTLLLPTGAACAGDSAIGGYRVQGYMVPASVDPASLTYDASGPVTGGVGANLRQPLYEASTTAFVNAQTANATATGGPGPIVSLPAFSLGVYSPGNILPGSYNLGIACTLGSASATQLDRFWNVQITVAGDTADEPAQIAWTVGGGSTTTTTTGGSTTTTTQGGTTTTTTGGSTTTLDDTTTTTAFVAGGGAPTGTSVAGSVSLPVTGGSPMSLLVWSVLLLLCGRVAVLLARPPRVRPAKP